MIQGRAHVQHQQTRSIDTTADSVCQGQILDSVRQQVSTNATQNNAHAMGYPIHNLKVWPTRQKQVSPK